MATPREIAEWMLNRFNKSSPMYQRDLIPALIDKFGEEFTYVNWNGNRAINKEILAEFRKLTPTGVVWSASEQMWRKRKDTDPPNRRIVWCK